MRIRAPRARRADFIEISRKNSLKKSFSGPPWFQGLPLLCQAPAAPFYSHDFVAPDCHCHTVSAISLTRCCKASEIDTDDLRAIAQELLNCHLAGLATLRHSPTAYRLRRDRPAPCALLVHPAVGKLHRTHWRSH